MHYSTDQQQSSHKFYHLKCKCGIQGVQMHIMEISSIVILPNCPIEKTLKVIHFNNATPITNNAI